MPRSASSTTSKKVERPAGRSLMVSGLFAGVGGIERGLQLAGHASMILSEVDPWACAVLAKRFPEAELAGDVRSLRRLPKGTNLLAAGFPCQDLSLAGTRSGLQGERSGLVSQVFRLLSVSDPELVLLENVSNLLRLGRGVHMRAVLSSLEEQGYRWAYRLVDTRGFGIPQRRLRVVILASKGEVEPSDILFRQQVRPAVDDTIVEPVDGHGYGFYWTEGKRGVGWAVDAVPTIKGGSGLGIPSPPAVFDARSRRAGTPSIRDAERLQGFSSGWTDVLQSGVAPRPGDRWKMVGNAVTVKVAEWVGKELAQPRPASPVIVGSLRPNQPMPHAAMSSPGGPVVVDVSTHVRHAAPRPILEFLLDDLRPLSERALSGYLTRVRSGSKTLPEGFLVALEAQLRASASR